MIMKVDDNDPGSSEPDRPSSFWPQAGCSTSRDLELTDLTGMPLADIPGLPVEAADDRCAVTELLVSTFRNELQHHEAHRFMASHLFGRDRKRRHVGRPGQMLSANHFPN